MALFALALALALALATPGPVAADERANVYVAGADVRVETPVNGDLYAVAGRVSVSELVRGDAVIAGGSIDFWGAVEDDLRATGGAVTLAGRVAGEALVAAGTIAFGRNAEVLGRVWLAGGDIAVAGKLLGGLKIYGRNVVIVGEVAGPVELRAERIEVTSSARIRGPLQYSSPNEIRIDPQAKIAGDVTRIPEAFEFPRPSLNLPGLPPLRPLLLLGLLAAGALLLAIFPGFSRHAVATLRLSPLKSVGLGTAIFFSLPPVILLLVITIIGIPIALVLAALYAAALLVGYLVTALFLGERLLHVARPRREPTYGWRLAALATALVLLALAYALPYVGILIVLLALFAGLGAMVLQAFTRYAATG